MTDLEQSEMHTCESDIPVKLLFWKISFGTVKLNEAKSSTSDCFDGEDIVVGDANKGRERDK